MKQMIQGFLLAGTLVLAGSALAQGSKPQGQEMGGKGTAELRGFMVPTDEKAFLERLHYTNQQEIKLGRLAQQNSMNPDVKSFGEQMVKDHTAADQRIMSMAQGRGMKLADMPKPMNDLERKAMAADKANMEKLQALKGEPFDSCYMATMVGDHDDTLGKLMAGRRTFTANAQLTPVLDEVTQTVSQHRQHAYSILGKLSPQGMGVGGAGEGTGGMHKGTGGMHQGSESGMGGHMGTGSTSGSSGTTGPDTNR